MKALLVPAVAADASAHVSSIRYRKLLAVSQPDVLIVNHGAHHGGDIEAYANNMKELFNLVKGLGFSRPQPAAKGGGNGKVFLWSTTTEQHFDTPTGDFDPKTQKVSPPLRIRGVMPPLAFWGQVS